MDSLTQILLGGAVATTVAPPEHRRAALLAGAGLGTLPDLDSLPIWLLTDDPVARMALRRGASHALFVLPLIGAPARWRVHRRAGLGTLPDLDSLPIWLLTDDPVALMTLHRGASHSLFVLPLVGALLWWLFHRRGGRVAQAPVRWFWAIQLALVTHPLLDAFTVY